MWKYRSKYPRIELMIIFLCFTLIFGIFAGCIGTSTVSTPSGKIDPIVGSWMYPVDSNLTQYYNLTFTQNGQILNREREIGNWVKNQDSKYSITDSGSGNTTWVYDQNTDTLYDQRYPNFIIYRIIETPKTTPVVSDTPILDRYRYCRDTYSGHTYDPKTNKCVLASTVQTKTPTQIITATPTQDNYQYCRDTYPGSSYNPSTNKCAYPTTVPTKAPTQGSIFKDPIIGTWKTFTQYTSDMIFFENGKGMWGDTVGTWEKIDSTHYSFEYYGATYEGGGYKANRGITYDPRLDTLTFGSQIYKRA